MNPNKTKEALQKLRAVQNPARFKILRYLHKHGPASVSRIWFHVRGDQSNISMHLSILRSAGIVYREQQGKEQIYHVDHVEMEKINEVVSELSSFLNMVPNDARQLDTYIRNKNL